jgi:hypothetical protein
MKQQQVFTYSLIIVGATEKVLQFRISLKSIYDKNFGFMEQKCIFENCIKVKTRKIILIDIIFVMKKLFW